MATIIMEQRGIKENNLVKRFVVVLTLTFGLLLLVACAQYSDTYDEEKTDFDISEQNASENSSTADKCNDLLKDLKKCDKETPQVTVYDALGNVVSDITDPTEITALTNAIAFDQWKPVTGELYCSEPEYYIDFHNGIAVGIDGTSAYGQLGQSFSVANETVKWDGFIGHFYMNDEFLNQVLEIVEKMVSAISHCTSLK